jgi:hypothetical protein
MSSQISGLKKDFGVEDGGFLTAKGFISQPYKGAHRGGLYGNTDDTFQKI